jgi:hypothetical protein
MMAARLATFVLISAGVSLLLKGERRDTSS